MYGLRLKPGASIGDSIAGALSARDRRSLCLVGQSVPHASGVCSTAISGMVTATINVGRGRAQLLCLGVMQPAGIGNFGFA